MCHIHGLVGISSVVVSEINDLESFIMMELSVEVVSYENPAMY